MVGSSLFFPLFWITTLVYSGALLRLEHYYMQKRMPSRKMSPTSSLRISVSFPPDIYQTIEQIAKQKKVSIAWVVRDATDRYVADQWPLFKAQG